MTNARQDPQRIYQICIHGMKLKTRLRYNKGMQPRYRLINWKRLGQNPQRERIIALENHDIRKCDHDSRQHAARTRRPTEIDNTTERREPNPNSNAKYREITRKTVNPNVHRREIGEIRNFAIGYTVNLGNSGTQVRHSPGFPSDRAQNYTV